MRGNIIVIDDGGGGSSSNERKRSQTATSTPTTTQNWATKPTAQARGNQHVVQINDGGGLKKSATPATQPFRNPQALGGPNPYAAAQRLSRATSELEQARGEYIVAQHRAHQIAPRPHGDNTKFHEAQADVAATRNKVDTLNKEIESITGVSGSDRIGLTFNGALTGMGASYVGAGGTVLKGMDMIGRTLTDDDILTQKGALAAQKHAERQNISKPHGDNSANRAARAETRRLRQKLSELTAQKETEAIENQLGLMKAASALDTEYERLAQKSANDIARAKLGRPAAERFLIDATVAGTQVAADGLANVIVPGSSIALKGVRSFGDASQEARRAGATIGQQIAYGGAVAGLESGVENFFDGLGGAYGKGTFDKLGRVQSVLPQAREAVEAGFTTAVKPALKGIYNNKPIGENYTSDVWSDALRDAMIKGAASSVINAWSDAQNWALDKAYDTAMQPQTQATLRKNYVGSSVEKAMQLS